MLTKEVYEQDLQSLLDTLSEDIDKLKIKAYGAKGDELLKYQKEMGELLAKQEAGSSRLNELKDTAEGAWDHLIEEIDTASDSLGGT